MKRNFMYLIAIIVVGCSNNNNKPPVASKKDVKLEKHGDTRIDPYFWMNQRDTPEVLDYLNAENDYYKKETAHTEDFQKTLFEEMKSRIKEDDSSVPYKYNGYWYIVRFEEGKNYPIYTRKKENLDAEEEIMFDCNKMAEGHSYFRLAGLNISPDNKWVAFATDTVGRRIYTLQIKNLETGEILPDTIENVTGGSAWANDNEKLFYTLKNPQTLRSEIIMRHQRGTNSDKDTQIFHEKDDTFNTGVYTSKSKKYIIIVSSSTMSDEYRFVSADNPKEDFTIFQPRIRGLEYNISHYGDHFYILNNSNGATNFKLDKTPVTNTTKEHWQNVIPHREDTLLENIDIFKDYLVLSERNNGLNKIRIIRWDGTKDEYLPFESETYTAYTTTNVDFDTPKLRYSYNSLTTPPSVVEYDMNDRSKTILKEQEVLGGKFNKENYASERVWATADDGTKIPVSMVYRKGMQRNGKTPLLLYGYGSYGATIDPYFSSSRLSLLDRGFIFAIAHIRGGEYLGRNWYENGKLLTKKNTFTDFINVGEYLVAEKYTSPEHLYAMGGSAGGLLMGAIINMKPELFNGVVAQVPFVDVVTTMLDDTIPLTTGEYDEWGNPNDKEYYEYIKSYSPYDNVKAQKYPNMLVTTGYHDSQVQYWEPAKWVAKLRDLKTDDNKLYFHTNMDAGHSGASGRFDALKEVAEEYSFILNLENIVK